MSMEEVQNRIQSNNRDFLLLDVREHDMYQNGHTYPLQC